MDLYHLRNHRELRAEGHVGNSCVMAIELDGRVDVGWLERRMAEAVASVPELGWAVSRSLRGGPVWRTRDGAPPLPRLRIGGGDLLDAATRLLHEPLDRAHPWRIYVLRGERRDQVALRWFHPFTDALGSARLLAWLGSEEGAPPAAERFQPIDHLLTGVDREQRRQLVSAYAQHGEAVGNRPIISLWGAAGRGAPGPQDAVRLRLSSEETTAFRRSLRKRSQLADTPVLLHAVSRLFDGLLATRGLCPPRLLIPVPVSFDSKRGCRRMFGNHVSMLMLTVDRDDIDSEARVVTSVARQRREIVRKRLDLGMLVALDLLRRAPDPLVEWVARRPFGGERCSTLLSNPGVLPIERFAGCEVVDALPSPVVLTAPGFMVVSSEHRGRLSLQLIYRRGYVRRGEVVERLGQLRHDLLGAAG